MVCRHLTNFGRSGQIFKCTPDKISLRLKLDKIVQVNSHLSKKLLRGKNLASRRFKISTADKLNPNSWNLHPTAHYAGHPYELPNAV